MTFRSAASTRRFVLRPLGKMFAFTLLVCVTFDSARAASISVGALETIYSKSQRTSKSLSSWPDGNFGVISNGNGTYDFYGANGAKPVKTTGTLLTPGTGKTSVSITNIPSKTYNYVSGGPVYQDPASGARLMIYHAEKHGSSAKDYTSVLGMAVSTDAAHKVFRDLGTIVEPNLQFGQSEINGGSFAVIGNQLNVYYRDWFPNGTTAELAVARAPLDQLVSNALAGVATPFTKYYNGSWSQPGRGGLASPLEVGNPSNGWTAVSYNDYLNKLVMVSSQWTPSQPDLYLSTSSDGVNWSPRQAVVTDAGEQFYPTLIGTGSDPQHTGKSFYLYYTDSKKGAWSRWSDAKLVRREITFDPLSGQPVVPPDPGAGGSQVPSPPPANGWAQISDYASDFQIGAPSAGWRYAWNPTGVAGNAAAYTNLNWSSAVQAYNTTGGATPVPGSKTHHDDYLTLSSGGGHPGEPKYFPIIGYTIQADDGAGAYRLTDSAIRKGDSLTNSKEDGLGVMVYVNNTRIGSAQTVSTNGSVVSFNRDLGNLNVGDTIWVMVDPLKNQLYDSFTSFDFSIQKSVPITQAASLTTPNMLFLSTSGVPEPGTITLFAFALAGCVLRRPRRKAN